MKNTRLGRRSAVRLASAAVALTAAFILTMMTAAAATINATDVTVRNSAEDRSDYSNAIGVLNQGDQVTVISRTTDSSGVDWYYVELENGNKGYVKAQWVDNGGETVAEEEPAAAEEGTQGAGGEDLIDEEDAVGDDDWTEEDADMLTGTPASGEGADGGEDAAADSQNTPAVDNGQEYDPYTDPNAQFGINFYTESNGTGSWYIYNYDTDKRIRIGDLEKLNDAQNAAQKSAASAGRWRAAACILLILLAALIIFLYVVFRRNGDGGPARRDRTRRKRSLSRRDRDEGEDAFFQEEDEETVDASAEQETDDRGADTEDFSDEASDEDSDEDADDFSDDEEKDSAPRRKNGGLFGSGGSGGRGSAGSAPDEEEEDDGEEDGYFDEDDSGEDEDSDEEAPHRGGFLSMLKNIFSSDDTEEDYDDEEDEDDEGYDDEDYDEDEEEELPPVRKQSRRSSSESKSAPRPRPRPARRIRFDEEADYPEDVGLIPSGAGSSAQDDVVTEDMGEAEDAAPGRTEAPVSGQRKPKDAAFEIDGEEEAELLADDDDDMEYSFLNRSSMRGARKK